MYKRKFKYYKHLYKFGCIFLSAIILVCTFALPTFAMTIKPIDSGGAGGSIHSINENTKINIYCDNELYTYKQWSGYGSVQYFILGFDNVTDVDYNDTHYGDLVAIGFSFDTIRNSSDVGAYAHYLGDAYVGGLLIEATILQGGLAPANRGYIYYTETNEDLLWLEIVVPNTNRLQNECNLMTYTMDGDHNNMVYDNLINIKLGTYATLPYMRMPYDWSAVNQLEYEELFVPNVYLMQYLKGNFGISGNLELYGYIDGNGYKFDDIAELFSHGAYPFTIQYSIDGSIGYDPPDYPGPEEPPDDPPPVDPPESSTSSTTPTIPTIDPNEPISTLPTGNIPDVDDDTKNTIVLIIDHMWSGFYTTFSTLLSQTGIFGMSLLSIFAILILLIVGAFLIKLWRGN